MARQDSSSGPAASALTFATTTSIPPNRSAESATQAASAAPSRTSSAVPATSPAISDAAFSTSGALRAQNATDAPSATSPSTTARPMPFVPPVTSATFPLRCRSMSLLEGLS